MFVKVAAILLSLAFRYALAGHTYCYEPNDVRLYPDYGTYGSLQVCYGGYWRTACDYAWGYEEAKVACNQLGLSGGCYYPISSAGYYYGYSWSYYMSNYYSCTGDEASLSECSLYSPSYYGYCNDAYYDGAGVVCSQAPQDGSDSCTQGELRLTGGADSGEGRVEYCPDTTWVPFCSLSFATAGLICAQLGYTQYTWSSVFDDERYGVTGVNSYFSYMYCSSYYSSLDQCTPQFNYQCTSSVCSTEYGMKCYNPGVCEEGTMRLAGGQIEQEGRPEVCLNGVWGSICGYGWNQLDGFMFCEDLGYTEPGTGPYVSTNSEFGDGEYPIVYSYVNCQGYEKSFKDCYKSVYPYFSCPRNTVAGLRCFEDCADGDIRLVGGTESEGTVEICYGQLWGLVAETGWDNVDAQVACHQLGYPTDTASAVYGTFYGKPNKAVHVSNVNCNGNEERIADCTKTSISLDEGKTTYKSASVAGIKCLPPPDPTCVDNINGVPTGSACETGTARLFGGDKDNEGTLQYCYKGQWSPACSLNEATASVLCKQLGYLEYTYAAIFTNGEFPSFLQHSYFNNITCSSHASESTLADCDIYEGDCLPICQNSNIGIRCFQPTPCEQGTVRLSDGFIDQEGRVEVCHDNVWGTICDDGWDNTDAHVICSQLGYDKLEPIAFSNSYFGAGDGPVIYSQMACGGWERDIDDCNKAEVLEFTCSRDNVAGILCGYDCVDGDVRLTNMEMATPGSVEGTLEVCYNKIWGLISESGWTTKDAKVACVELGYIGEGAIPIGNTDADKPNKPVLLGDVSCQGDEATLGDCSATVYSLQEGKDLLASVDVAGITCLIPSNCDVPPTGGTECQVGATRLTGDDEPSKGNLEYCYNGYWSPTCALSEIDASIACKEFGFTNYTWASIFTDGRFSSDSGEVMSLLYSFNCTDAASTSRLVDCNLADNCTRVCDNPIGIQCYDQQQCEEGTVRLTGGAIAQEGRLEVCINGVWGSICSSGWDNTDAFVTCKQLGYGDAEPISYTNSEFGEGTGPIVFSNLGCDGWEKNIVQCYWSEYGSFSCSRDKLVGVLCHDDCKDGQIRLVGGSTDVEGTIEICFDSLWGAISATTWTDANTRVTCKQLGYTGGSSVPGSQYGKPNVAVHLSSVYCQGSEDQLTDCELYPVDLEDGKELGVHVAFAGVACTPPATDPPTTTTDTMTSTDTTTAEVGAVSSTTSDSLFYIIASVLVVLIVIVMIVLIIAVVAFVIKLRKGKTPTQTGFQIGPNQTKPFNVQSEAVNPLAGLDDHDMED